MYIFTPWCTKIRANDIKEFVNKAYDSGHYWPDPLIQQNPSFVIGQTVEELVKNNKLHDKCKKTFRFGRDGEHPGITTQLYKHQEEALAIAQKKESYVLTTGTGSGKSLAYMLPIVDHILKIKQPSYPTIKAIIIYSIIKPRPF